MQQLTTQTPSVRRAGKRIRLRRVSNPRPPAHLRQRRATARLPMTSFSWEGGGRGGGKSPLPDRSEKNESRQQRRLRGLCHATQQTGLLGMQLLTQIPAQIHQ